MGKRYLANEVYEHKYVKIPKELFINKKYAHLNSDAKILYALLLDRMELSRRNGWVNEKGEIYLVLTRQEVMEMMGISDKTATKAFRQLKEAGLIEEERQGRGLPNLIYICRIEHEPLETHEGTKTRKNYDSRPVNFTSQETENLRANKTYISKTDINETDNNNSSDDEEAVVVEKNTVKALSSSVSAEDDSNKKATSSIEDIAKRVEEVLGQRIAKNILESLSQESIEQALKAYEVISKHYEIRNPAGFFVYLAREGVEPPRTAGGRRPAFSRFEQHNWAPEQLENLWEPIG